MQRPYDDDDDGNGHKFLFGRSDIESIVAKAMMMKSLWSSCFTENATNDPMTQDPITQLDRRPHHLNGFSISRTGHRPSWMVVLMVVHTPPQPTGRRMRQTKRNEAKKNIEARVFVTYEEGI